MENIDDYRHRNRKFFEDKLRRDRNQMGIWIRYAIFEESQGEWPRARSIYERALDSDPYNITVFLKYAEMEMKNGNLNLARNVWDRATTIQPRVNQFWYKYAYMEETLGNVEGTRAIYERWLAWQPEEAIWYSYIKFEKRYKQWDRIRAIFERLVRLHNTIDAWLAYAKFEQDGGRIDKARSVHERAVEAVTEEKREPRMYIEFAKFEVHVKEYERARIIYKFALDRFPKSQAEGLYNSYAHFERQYGDEKSMAEVVITKRRSAYIEKVTENPMNYDAWFDYIRLEEEHGDVEIVREVYERAIANIPPAAEKRLWRRYIYLWVYYAVFEELSVKDQDRALAIYKAIIDMIPHGEFTFAKLWVMLAHLYLRRGDLVLARKTMGTSIGLCPKPKLFKDYIQMELQLREFDRCRILYEKFLEYDSANSQTWLAFAELERLVMEEDRARAIYELAISQEIDLPETVWKAYIDWEAEEGRLDKARVLYERLLEKTGHIKVWVSYAHFEAQHGEIDMARAIFERSNEAVKEKGVVSERIILLEAWHEMELSWANNNEDDPSVKEIAERLPRKVIAEDDGAIEYIFPEDEKKEQVPPTSMDDILSRAHQWKAKSSKVCNKS